MTEQELTDKEIAYALGVRLIKAWLRVLAMKGELDSYHEAAGHHRQWRASVEKVYEQILVPSTQDKIEELRLALDGAKPKDLLRTLHKLLKEHV